MSPETVYNHTILIFGIVIIISYWAGITSESDAHQRPGSWQSLANGWLGCRKRQVLSSPHRDTIDLRVHEMHLARPNSGTNKKCEAYLTRESIDYAQILHARREIVR
jgi:hypothetical protein